MPTPLVAFDFAIIRIVPRVERQEFINAGVIVHSLERKYLGATVQIDEPRLLALWPTLDLVEVRQHLEAFPKICNGESDSGPIGSLSTRERFHWLVAPRSTIIQISPVHTGLCEYPEAKLANLFHQLVVAPSSSRS